MSADASSGVALWRGARLGASEQEIASQFDLAQTSLCIPSFEILRRDFEVLFRFASGGLERVTLVLGSALGPDEFERFSDDLKSLLDDKYGRSRKRKSDPDVREWAWESGRLKVQLIVIVTDEMQTLSVDYAANSGSELDKI